MITMDVILKIFITAVLGYVVLNTYFHYHFTVERINLVYIVMLVLVAGFFIGTGELWNLLITVGAITGIYLITKIVCINMKIHGYFMLNTYSKDYLSNKKELMTIIEEKGISGADVCYNKHRPFLFVIKNIKYKEIRDIIKKFDKFHAAQPKLFTMYNYWHIIVFFILMVLIWRF